MVSLMETLSNNLSLFKDCIQSLWQSLCMFYSKNVFGCSGNRNWYITTMMHET